MEAPSASIGVTEQSLSATPNPVLVSRERTLAKFASLLNAKQNISEKRSVAASKEITQLVSNNRSGEHVVLEIPSLEMTLSQCEGKNVLLPELGEHQSISPVSNASDSDASEDKPVMAASVLPGSEDGSMEMEKIAAGSMGKKTSWTKSTLMYSSHAVLTNITDAFQSLVNSRVRAWTLLLLKHSLSTGDAESRTRLLGMLTASIQITSVETNFKTLPMPKATAGQPKEADAILPMLFEAAFQLQVQGNQEKVTIRAPGTISAHFDESTLNSSKLTKVEMRMDTTVLMKTMVDQARIVVFKAVACATKTNVPSTLVSSEEKSSEKEDVGTRQPEGSLRLSSFQSAVTLSSSAADKYPQLQKARSSALRLNNVLHGKSDDLSSPSLGQRKLRSVNWGNSLHVPKMTPALTPNPKKQRMAQAAAKLKSFKSFGRPHAGDLGSGPRNATFGEFGRQELWGRNGRMAHHPSPRNESSQYEVSTTTSGLADRNATFNLQRKSNTPGDRGTLSLPRSATVLENWLLKKNNLQC